MLNLMSMLKHLPTMAFCIACFACASAPEVVPDPQATPQIDPQIYRRAAWNAIEEENFPEAGRNFVLAASLGSEAPSDYYNASCSFALAGQVDDGMDMLQQALDAGYSNRSNMLFDEDLNNLRNDSRFAALLERTVELSIRITENVKASAEDAEFVFDDAHHFVHAMKMVKAGAEIIHTLEKEYFAKATPGLKQMLVKYPFSAESLAEAIGKNPEMYQRIEHNVSLLEARVPEFREAYAHYKDFAPSIVFPPTYFLVDRNRGIGSGSPDGQLISIERRTDESIGRLESLLVHELTHFQQLLAVGSDEFYAVFGAKKSLLALSIREGTAQFIAARVTGLPSKLEAREYILANEEEVWRRFQGQMMTRTTKDWMWSTPSDPDQPRDIAYEFGALIVDAYYNHAPDQQEALEEMFAVTNFKEFLDRSGYAARFSEESE